MQDISQIPAQHVRQVGPHELAIGAKPTHNELRTDLVGQILESRLPQFLLDEAVDHEAVELPSFGWWDLRLRKHRVEELDLPSESC